MKKFVYIVLILALLLGGGTGCALFRNPMGSWTKAETKVEEKQEKLDANQNAIYEQGKNYVYATKLAIQADPSTNKYHRVEQQLNDKAVATLGTPPMEEIVKLEAMVNNLLSENQKLVIKGEKQLAEQNDVVVDLQQENAQLKSELGIAQKKLVDVGTTNTGFAQKWATLMKVFWWIVYGIIFVFVIKILAVVLPPPYNSIVGIIALPFGLVTKLIHALVPEAKAVAGVVSAEYKTGTQDLVMAIQKLKEKHPELHKEISETVYANTDSDTSAVAINKAKSDLGLAS